MNKTAARAKTWKSLNDYPSYIIENISITLHRYVALPK